MTQDVYWSAYSLEETLARLQAQNEKDMVDVQLDRGGRTSYALTIRCNDNGRKGEVEGMLEVKDDGRVRLQMKTYGQRNRQLAMVLVPVALASGAWAASATGSIVWLAVVAVMLVIGSNITERWARPRKMALALLREAIENPGEPRKPSRRRRMKKRQWGKE